MHRLLSKRLTKKCVVVLLCLGGKLKSIAWFHPLFLFHLQFLLHSIPCLQDQLAYAGLGTSGSTTCVSSRTFEHPSDEPSGRLSPVASETSTIMVPESIPVDSPATIMSSSRVTVTDLQLEMNPVPVTNLLARISQWGTWGRLVQVDSIGYRLEVSMNLSYEEGDELYQLSQSDRFSDVESESSGEIGSDRGDVVDYEGNLE